MIYLELDYIVHRILGVVVYHRPTAQQLGEVGRGKLRFVYAEGGQLLVGGVGDGDQHVVAELADLLPVGVDGAHFEAAAHHGLAGAAFRPAAGDDVQRHPAFAAQGASRDVNLHAVGQDDALELGHVEGEDQRLGCAVGGVQQDVLLDIVQGGGH